MKRLKKYLPAVLMILLGITIGILMIIDAQSLTEFVFRLFGIALIVLAIVLTVRYLVDRKHDDAHTITLITAIISLIIGLVLAIGAKMIVDAGSLLVAIFYGSVLIINGVLKITEYFSMKRQGVTVSGIRNISGILSIVIGVVAFVFCGQEHAMDFLGILIGISLLANSVLDIAALTVAYRLEKHYGSLYDTSGDDSDYDLE